MMSKNIAQEAGQGHQQVVKILHKNKNKKKDEGEGKGKGKDKGIINKVEGKGKGKGKNVIESPQNIAQGHQQVVKGVPKNAKLGQEKIVKQEAKYAQYVQGQKMVKVEAEKAKEQVQGAFVYRAEITTYSRIAITARQAGPPIKRRPRHPQTG